MMINGRHTDMDGNVIDSFVLEQKIFEAWHVVDDLKLLYTACEGMNEDQIMSAIHGLSIFADMRFQSLLHTFEQCTANEVFDDNDRLKVRNREDMVKAFESFGQEPI